jgi:integrase
MPRPRAERPTYSLAKRPMPGGAIRYYVQWWEDGAARRVSCRTGQLAAARRFLAEFEAGRGTPVAPLAPTVGAILDGYQAERETKPVSPTLGYNVAHLKAVLADLPADALTKERVRHYLAARRKVGAGGAPAQHRVTKRPLADSTLRRELLTLRAALVWAQREGWITTVPHVEAPGQGRTRDRWLTRDEATRLLVSARQAHVRVFVALALYTAGRTGALLALTWDRVDLDAGVVDLGEGQGNKRRARVPLHPALRPLLVEAKEARTTDRVVEHGGQPVASVKTGFRNATVRAGLPGVTPYVLRHTAATWMAQAGVSLVQIAGYLGNSAATVERVYAHHHPNYMAEASAALTG